MSSTGNKSETSFLQRSLIHAVVAAYRSRRRAATVLVVLVALWFGYNAIFGQNGIDMFEHKRAENRAIQQQILELQQENSKLRQNIQELKSDPDAIEHEARERLHYARPGEVIWTEDGPPAASPTQPPAK